MVSVLSDISDSEILEVWQLCSKAYLQHGVRIKFPEGTEPCKTYQWRFIKAITRKFKEWQFDVKTSEQFMDIAIAQAKQRNALNKGLSALHQPNMLELCYEILTKRNKQREKIVDSLNDMKIWFDSQIGDDKPIDVLLRRKNKRSLPNIIIWKQASKISDLFISLSRSCCKAVSTLQTDEVEARMIPSPISLFLIRADFLNEQNNVRQTKSIFGKDWRGS